MGRFLTLLAICLPFLLSATPEAAITYQGTIIDPKTGEAPPPTTPITLTFRLYHDEEGGKALWGRTTPVKVSESGDFYVELTDATGNAVPSALFDDLDETMANCAHGAWLSIAAFDGTETERVRIASVHHAYRARVASAVTTLEAKEISTRTLSASESAEIGTLRAKSVTIEGGGISRLRTEEGSKGEVAVSGVFHLDNAIGGPGFATRSGAPSGKAKSDSVVIRACDIPGVGRTYSSLLFPGGSTYGGTGEPVCTISLGVQ